MPEESPLVSGSSKNWRMPTSWKKFSTASSLRLLIFSVSMTTGRGTPRSVSSLSSTRLLSSTDFAVCGVRRLGGSVGFGRRIEPQDNRSRAHLKYWPFEVSKPATDTAYARAGPGSLSIFECTDLGVEKILREIMELSSRDHGVFGRSWL